MTERGVAVDHSTIYRWVQRFAPEMEKRLRRQWRRPQSRSWRVDETYIKVRGKWAYLYRAVDNGEIMQFAPPRELFHEPANDMVARFIGDGCVVEVEQLVPLGDGRAKAVLMGSELTLRCAPGALSS